MLVFVGITTMRMMATFMIRIQAFFAMLHLESGESS
jgi:hypothetical protein